MNRYFKLEQIDDSLANSPAFYEVPIVYISLRNFFNYGRHFVLIGTKYFFITRNLKRNIYKCWYEAEDIIDVQGVFITAFWNIEREPVAFEDVFNSISDAHKESLLYLLDLFIGDIDEEDS